MVVLEVSNAITFVRITSFMKTNKNMVMVDRKLALKASGRISISNINDTDVGYVKDVVICSDYLYMGIQSAIYFYFEKEA